MPNMRFRLYPLLPFLATLREHAPERIRQGSPDEWSRPVSHGRPRSPHAAIAASPPGTLPLPPRDLEVDPVERGYGVEPLGEPPRRVWLCPSSIVLLSLRSVVAEPVGEKRQSVHAALADLAGESPPIARAGRESFAHVRDQCTVNTDERVREDVRSQVAHSGAGFLG